VTTLTYRTRDGDVVDDIVWRHYGTQNSAMLREVFKANPDLADRGVVLAAGVDILLPDFEQPADEIRSVALWD
jgi:phage tail protein X